MTRRKGQGPPDVAPGRGQPDADRDHVDTSDGAGALRLQTEDATSWWERELRSLGADILAEPVPERLRATCSDAQSGDDGRHGHKIAGGTPDEESGETA